MQITSPFSYFFSETPVLQPITNEDDFIKALTAKNFKQSDLRHYFTERLFPDEQDSLLMKAVIAGFETDNPELINRCINLLNFDEMQSLLADTHKKIDIFNKSFELRQQLNAEHPKIKNSEINQTVQSELKQGLPYLFNLVISFINTVIYSTNILELGKQPESAWDANFQLQIYYQLIAIPLGLFFALQTLITNPILVVTAFLVSFITLLSSLYAYLRWLQPAPTRLPYAENLTLAVKQGLVKQVVGRHVEIQSIIQRISNPFNKEIRKQPLLVGPSGVGKNEIINGVAYELFHNTSGLVPQNLRNKQVFILNAADLLPRNSFKSLTPLQELKASIGRHGKDIVLIINEAQSIVEELQLKETMKTSLDPSSLNGLPFCIFITSDDKKEKFEEPSLKSRLEVHSIKEMKPEQTFEVLQSLAATEPDIEATNANLKDLINSEEGLQPTPAKQKLIGALHAVQENLNGTALKEKLYKWQQRKAELQAKIPSKISGKELLNLEPLFNEIDEIEKKIQKQIKKIQAIEKIMYTLRNMKKRGEALEKSFSCLVDRLKKPSWIDRRNLTALKLQYLFTEFYLLPAKDETIKQFAVKHDLKTSLKDVL